jgi:hypothetical protein
MHLPTGKEVTVSYRWLLGFGLGEIILSRTGLVGGTISGKPDGQPEYDPHQSAFKR